MPGVKSAVQCGFNRDFALHEWVTRRRCSSGKRAREGDKTIKGHSVISHLSVFFRAPLRSAMVLGLDHPILSVAAKMQGAVAGNLHVPLASRLNGNRDSGSWKVYTGTTYVSDSCRPHTTLSKENKAPYRDGITPHQRRPLFLHDEDGFLISYSETGARSESRRPSIHVARNYQVRILATR